MTFASARSELHRFFEVEDAGDDFGIGVLCFPASLGVSDVFWIVTVNEFDVETVGELEMFWQTHCREE